MTRETKFMDSSFFFSAKTILSKEEINWNAIKETTFKIQQKTREKYLQMEKTERKY